MQEARHRRVQTRRRVSKPASTVRVGPLSGIVTVTREHGVDPDEVLEQFGLTTAQFDDPDFKIPYATVGRLLARCAEATQCPHFGLQVGIGASPSSLGLPGFLLLNAPDVGTALRLLVQNLDLHDQGGIAVLDIQKKLTVLGYAILQAYDAEALDQIYDLALAIGCNIMRRLCGVGWNPTEVLFSRHQPEHPGPYIKFYRAPLRFDMDRNALVFLGHWMNHAVPTADALLHRHLEKEASELRMRRQTDITGDTRRLLSTAIMTGNCTANDIAEQLCLHERTLHRRLREEGSSFRLELDAVRYAVARQLLVGSAMPVAAIAETLHYSGACAFIRAFKRWAGATPARWRAKNTVFS